MDSSSDSDDDRGLAAPDTKRLDDKGKRQEISESEPSSDDSRKEEGRSLPYKRMSRSQKMDDKKKRQEISESEPRSNDSSKKKSSQRSNDSSKKESSPRSNDSIYDTLLFWFFFLVLVLCYLVLWCTVYSAWDYLMKWAKREQ